MPIAHDVKSIRDSDAGSTASADFRAFLSHEMRSPLNAILGWTRLLTMKRPDDPEIAAIAPRIERSARVLLKLADDLIRQDSAAGEQGSGASVDVGSATDGQAKK